jgi:hypothetical protein
MTDFSGNWLYYGIFFDDETKRRLLTMANSIIGDRFGHGVPDGYRTYCDHVTLIYNDGKREKMRAAQAIEKTVGRRINVEINSIGISEKAIAFGVGNIVTQNKHSHITVATAPGAKPVDSNAITEWTQIDGFDVYGTVKRVDRRY